MSDNSSMMMVVVIGGIMCCGMSCVGGLVGWYVYDPTLNGLLPGPSPDGYGGSGPPAGDAPPVADPPPDTGISGTQDAYIFHKGCSDVTSGARYSLLAGHPTTGDVQMSCQTGEVNGYIKKWRFTKIGNGTLYYIQLRGSATSKSLYLTVVEGKLWVMKKETSSDPQKKAMQQWSISSSNADGRTIAVSAMHTKPFNDKKYRYLSFSADGRCATGGKPWMWFDPSETQWQFRYAKSTTPKMNRNCS